MYKMGESIFVRDCEENEYEERIYVKDGWRNSVICVKVEYNRKYFNGYSFNTIDWRYHKKMSKKKKLYKWAYLTGMSWLESNCFYLDKEALLKGLEDLDVSDTTRLDYTMIEVEE